MSSSRRTPGGPVRVGPSRATRLVAKRELREGLRNRTLMLTFGVMVVLLIGGIFVPSLLGGDDATTLAIVDGVAVDAEALRRAADTAELDLELSTVADVAAGELAIEEGELDAVLAAPTELVVEQQADATLRAVVGEVAGQQALLEAFGERGVDPAQAARALADVPPLQVRPLDEPESDVALLFAVGGTGLLLFGVTFFASAVLTGVVEEKSSRVVEVVLGAMRPWQLLAGKLLGIGTLAIGQVLVLLGVAVGALTLSGTVELPTTTTSTVLAVAVWFVLGFALYAVLYAAAGALVNRVEDAQSSAGPIGFLLFVAYAAAFAVVVPNPDSAVARIASMIPGVSPLTMPARVALGSATPVEQTVAIALSVVVTGVAVRLAGRIYERSVLRTQQVTWREALRRSR